MTNGVLINLSDEKKYTRGIYTEYFFRVSNSKIFK